MDWSAWRRRWATEPLYRRVRNGIQPFTLLQRHLLSGGDAWWESQLLAGQPDWNALTYARPSVLSEEEKAFLAGPVVALGSQLEQASNEGERMAGDTLRMLLLEHGFHGLSVPGEYGGLGLSAWAQSEVIRQIALRSVPVAYMLATRFVFGPAAVLKTLGTAEQKAYWLPRMASGRDAAVVATFVVENDIVPIQATGVVLNDAEGESPVLRLNWTGARHVPGPRPGLLVLPFRLHDPQGILGNDAEGCVAVALVDTTLPGVEHYRVPGNAWSASRPRYAGGEDEHAGSFDGHDVQLPLSGLLGGAESLTRALPTLLAAQSLAKGIALPALSSASVSLAAHAASAVLRLQGEESGCKMLGARSRLGRLAANTYRIEACRRFLCSGIDLGYRPALTASLVDISVYEDVRSCLGDSMDLLGGAGPTPALTEWQQGLHELLPALFGFDALAAQGRNLRVLALGILRVHPYFVKEFEALENPDVDAGCQAFDQLVWKHLAGASAALSKATLRAWTGGRLSRAPRLVGPVARHYRRVNRYASALAVMVELLQPGVQPVHARNEPGLERLLRALAILVSFCAVLKRWQDDGRHESDLPLVEWCAADSWHTLDVLMEGMLENLETPLVGTVLRPMVLPPGQRSVEPGDAVTLECAELLLVPSDTRERLVGSVWGNHGLRHLASLERAYECVVQVHELREQIRQAGLSDWRHLYTRGGLTDSQAQALEAAEAAVLAALRGEEACI